MENEPVYNENRIIATTPEELGNAMKKLDVVKLKSEFQGLPEGTQGTIVLEYDGKCFEVEFVDSDGDTIDVLTTPTDVLELVIEYKQN